MKIMVIDYREKDRLNRLLEKKFLIIEKVREDVWRILNEVRRRGDKALFKYTKRFDKFDLNCENLRVKDEEIENAYDKLDKSDVNALKHAKRNIERFHKEQFKRIERSWEIETEIGILGKMGKPIERIGVYSPKGIRGYPSTVLMNSIPARIAGVDEISLISSPEISESVLVAADLCGIDKIYRVGGAHGIGALAYGTETIEKVDKIVGPGNIYVTAAKIMVYGVVDIDMPAGPSEILIIADESANPRFIAADMLSQLEHDSKAQAILVTTSQEIVDETKREINAQIKSMRNYETIMKSIENSAIILAEDIEECIEFVNRYAPEHLEIMARNPKKLLREIRNAGSIFLGNYSPVPAGDYASGTNHVLPTSGTARFSSSLSVMDFLKFSDVQFITRDGLKRIKKTVERIANLEGFDAHSKAIEIRFSDSQT
ncbi:MAG: histidinol dehydrogenase [Candidatus Altiarchaeales archaeon]|nr:MAG: histidinol dehydrogenase [Candidatus Altiarchaeales archaeon]RLI95418.1 MAG: histidinol dehydrogenase [Candidatus Altiarchaeales archaeon]HDO82359.1 histidinol dehydrogenase [Candidatus Altiarchaeales archaeon]HEX55008.1 histidinol dehydrogenase [Candidatus Altiarchaeales archaeon]